MAAIALALGQPSCGLQHLVLAGNPLRQAGGEALGDALAKCPALESLCVTKCGFNVGILANDGGAVRQECDTPVVGGC